MSVLSCENVELNITECHKNMHENQLIVSHVCLSANDVLKKMWMYKILQIRPKSTKFLKTASRKNSTCNSTSVLARYNELGSWQ